MSIPDLIISLTLLALCLAGIVVTATLALRQYVPIWLERRHTQMEIIECHTEALALDELRTDLMIMEMEYQFPEKPVSNRHNPHCPACGRFAKRGLPGTDTVVICKVHDMQVRWTEIPVDWMTDQAVAAGTVVKAAPVTVETASLLLLDHTGPIEIIQEDVQSLEELEELGAVL